MAVEGGTTIFAPLSKRRCAGKHFGGELKLRGSLALGVLIAPIAGKIADRRGPHTVIGLGGIVMLTSWAVLDVWGMIAGLIVGVILLDFGEQGALVSNQHVI